MKIRKALFQEGHVSKGGTCLSSFLVLRGIGGILVGKPAKTEIWIERFLVGEMFVQEYSVSGKYLIPASHLKYGESPDEAARRVLTEQVGLGKGKLSFLEVQSHVSGDRDNPDEAHWDICFLYEGRVKGKIERPEWFSELKFVKPTDLKSDDFTRGHGDVLKEAGVIKS